MAFSCQPLILLPSDSLYQTCVVTWPHLMQPQDAVRICRRHQGEDVEDMMWITADWISLIIELDLAGHSELSYPVLSFCKWGTPVKGSDFLEPSRESLESCFSVSHLVLFSVLIHPWFLGCTQERKGWEPFIKEEVRTDWKSLRFTANPTSSQVPTPSLPTSLLLKSNLDRAMIWPDFP